MTTAAALADGWPAVVVDAGARTTAGRRCCERARPLDGDGVGATGATAAAPPVRRRGRVARGRAGGPRVSDVAVVTIAHGRHDHLARAAASLAAPATRARPLRRRRDGRPRLVAGRRRRPAPHGRPVAATRPACRSPRPATAARSARSRAGPTCWSFLDVDCLAGPGLVAAYADAVATSRAPSGRGPVTYLPPARPGGYDLAGLAGSTRRTRPGPPRAAASAASTPTPTCSGRCPSRSRPRHGAQLGGFYEDYVGYGGEDTDFGRVLLAAACGWAGSARPAPSTSSTPRDPARRRHLDDILRNAAIFARAGAPGRWAAGSRRSSARAWCAAPVTGAGPGPAEAPPSGGTDRVWRCRAGASRRAESAGRLLGPGASHGGACRCGRRLRGPGDQPRDHRYVQHHRPPHPPTRPTPSAAPCPRTSCGTTPTAAALCSRSWPRTTAPRTRSTSSSRSARRRCASSTGARRVACCCSTSRRSWTSSSSPG